MNVQQINDQKSSHHRRGRNEGSISQDRRGGKYRAQFSMPNGQRISKSFETKNACKEWLDEQKNLVRKGYTHPGVKENLSSYLMRWLEKKAKLKAKTKVGYLRHIEKYLSPQLGSINLVKLSRETIEQFYLLQLKHTSTIMVTHIHRTLHSALEDAIRDGYLLINPAHYADRVIPGNQSISPNKRCLDENEARTFLIHSEGSPYEALYHLALKTGMRQAEMLGLKWDDVNWEQQSLLIHQQYQPLRTPEGIGVFTSPKSRSGNRTIPLGDELIEELKRHRDQQVMVKALAGTRWKENGLVFPSCVGTPTHFSNLSKDFRKIKRMSGLKPFRFHDLRHTAATLMLNKGVAATTVAGILGHSNATITLSIYGHPLSSEQRKAIRQLDDSLTPISISPEFLPVNNEKMGPENKSNCTKLHLESG
jgi:integrase